MPGVRFSGPPAVQRMSSSIRTPIPLKRRRHVEVGGDVEPGFDGHHHPRFEQPVRAVVVRVAADVVHVESDPMPGAVHVERFVGLFLERFVARARQQPDVEQPVDQDAQRGLMVRVERPARAHFLDAGFLRAQHDLVDRLLFGREAAADRPRPGDVGGVDVEFRGAVDEHERARSQPVAVGIVVKNRGVVAARDDRGVGGALRAAHPVRVLDHRFEFVLPHAGMGRAHAGDVTGAGDLARAAHDRDLVVVLDQPHLVHDRRRLDDRARREPAAPHPVPRLRERREHRAVARFVDAGRVVQRLRAHEIVGEPARVLFDRIGGIDAERAGGGLDAEPPPGPGFLFAVSLAQEQHDALRMMRRQHEHRVGFVEPRQVIEVGVLTELVLAIVAAGDHRGRGDDGDRAVEVGGEARAPFCEAVHVRSPWVPEWDASSPSASL